MKYLLALRHKGDYRATHVSQREAPHADFRRCQGPIIGHERKDIGKDVAADRGVGTPISEVARMMPEIP